MGFVEVVKRWDNFSLIIIGSMYLQMIHEYGQYLSWRNKLSDRCMEYLDKSGGSKTVYLSIVFLLSEMTTGSLWGTWGKGNYCA